jgi:putative Mg2+ transporter-C (MgtC) family protein
MFITPEDLMKLFYAILVGGLIGAEREFRDKSAGFRTMIFICMGAALFTMYSVQVVGGRTGDPGRIAAGIVTGVGFLGAGAIFRGSRGVNGLTTASTIWLVAALGMGIGAGYYLISGAAALAILAILWIFPSLEAWIDNTRHERDYEITCETDAETLQELESLFSRSGLKVTHHKRLKAKDCLVCIWSASGSPRKHDLLVEKLLAHPKIQEFQF